MKTLLTVSFILAAALVGAAAYALYLSQDEEPESLEASH